MVALIDGGVVVPVNSKDIAWAWRRRRMLWISQVGCNVVLVVARSSSVPARFRILC